MNLSFYIAKRYAISFSKNKAINIITGIASVGILASTMALFIFLSVFSGLKEFTLNFNSTSSFAAAHARSLLLHQIKLNLGLSGVKLDRIVMYTVQQYNFSTDNSFHGSKRNRRS